MPEGLHPHFRRQKQVVLVQAEKVELERLHVVVVVVELVVDVVVELVVQLVVVPEGWRCL